MPEAVISLLDNKGMETVEHVLQDILDLYELDFAKYATTKEIPRIHAIWHSLPSQLAKENRKFIYKVVKPGARSKDYEDALLWLEDAGMIYRTFNITKPALPVSAYEDPTAFKVYACDCGLLRRLAKLPATVVLNATANYTEFKGSMAENAVLQSLMPQMQDDVPHYWSSDSRAEIEFVIQQGEDIGTRYRTGIYWVNSEDEKTVTKALSELQKNYEKPIVVENEPLKNFYSGEEYHQDYLDKNPSGYCHINPELFELAKKANQR